MGYLSGTVYASFKLVSSNFIVNVIAIAVGFYLFDLFHVDGLLDTFDGFFNQSDAKKRLEIMSKGNIGPFAFFFAFLYFSLYLYSFHLIKWWVPIYSSVFGRLSMNVLLLFSQPAKESGLGMLLSPYKRSNIVYSFLFTLPLALKPIPFLISSILSFLVGYFMAMASNRNIDGYTGDVLGAVCLISQLFIMIAFTI